MIQSKERSRYDRWGLDLESSRGLEPARVPQTGVCWWCKEENAETAEHKYKATDLRRMTNDAEGLAAPSTLYRSGVTFSGELKSISRGHAVQWSKSLCKKCNGGRDHAMDTAYVKYSDFIWDNQDALEPNEAQEINWCRLYGPSWKEGARNLARYFAKQFGCMLAQQSLPVPEDVISFLDGADSAMSMNFAIVRDHWRRELHRIGHEDGIDVRGLWLPPTSISLSPDGTAITCANYEAYIGFIGVCVEYGISRPSWFFKHPRYHIKDIRCDDPAHIRRELKTAKNSS